MSTIAHYLNDFIYRPFLQIGNSLPRKEIKKLPWLLAFFVLLAAATLWASDPVSAEITIIDLGTLGGGWSSAAAINARGQVVGTSVTATGKQRAFLWEKGKMADLGTLGGDQSHATAINARGQVVGASDITPSIQHAFLWENGTMTDLGEGEAVAINERGQVIVNRGHAFLWENGTIIDLGTLGGDQSYPVAINARGQVVDNSITATGKSHAFLWENGTIIDLGTLGGDQSYATAINARGQVVGKSATAAGYTGELRPFLWENGTMVDLGTLGGPFSEATAINARGQVVGYSAITGEPPEPHSLYAFLWENGTMTILETPNPPPQLGCRFKDRCSWAVAINARGQVIGYRSTPGEPVAFAEHYPVLWENGRMVDLGTLGGEINYYSDNIVAINDQGQVVGDSMNHAVLWNTSGCDGTGVPCKD